MAQLLTANCTTADRKWRKRPQIEPSRNEFHCDNRDQQKMVQLLTVYGAIGRKVTRVARGFRRNAMTDWG